MTSLRQIEANRRNAAKSTGPRTEGGKQRSSQNAVRHGLTAETVITPLEDFEDYQAFEIAVTADYDAQTAVERELVLRLASLLWRLRRALSIETSLFQMQGEVETLMCPGCEIRSSENREVSKHFRLKVATTSVSFADASVCQGDDIYNICGDRSPGMPRKTAGFDIARRFLRLAYLDKCAFERLSRYEATLWRQARQTIFTLEQLQWRTARIWRSHRSRRQKVTVHSGSNW